MCTRRPHAQCALWQRRRAGSWGRDRRREPCRRRDVHRHQGKRPMAGAGRSRLARSPARQARSSSYGFGELVRRLNTMFRVDPGLPGRGAGGVTGGGRPAPAECSPASGKAAHGGGGAEPPGAIPCEASAVELLRLRGGRLEVGWRLLSVRPFHGRCSRDCFAHTHGSRPLTADFQIFLLFP